MTDLCDRDFDNPKSSSRNKEIILKLQEEAEKNYRAMIERRKAEANAKKITKTDDNSDFLAVSIRKLRNADIFGVKAMQNNPKKTIPPLGMDTYISDNLGVSTDNMPEVGHKSHKPRWLISAKTLQKELAEQLRLEQLEKIKQTNLHKQRMYALHDLEFDVLSSCSEGLKNGFYQAIIRRSGPVEDHEMRDAYRDLLGRLHSNFLGASFLKEIIYEGVAFCEMHHIYDDKVDMSQSKLAGLLNAELTEILVKIATKVKENNEFDARFKIDFLNRIDTEYNVHLDYLEEKYPTQELPNGHSNISEQLADQLIEKIKGKPIQAPRPSQIIAEKPSLNIERPDTQLNQPENILNFQKYVRNLDNGMLVVDIETPDVNDRRILSIGIAFWDKNTGDISPIFYQKTKPYNFQTVNKAAWTFRNGYLNYEEFVNMHETDYKALRCTDPMTNKDIELSELFSRYPATGFNVSRFDFPALKAAGIVSEGISVPFDLGDICKHLFKGRTHQVSEQEAYRLLFNDGNYCEKHDAIIDAMDEAKILGEMYKVTMEPKAFNEVLEKRVNPLQPISTARTQPKLIQTEIRLRQIKSLEDKPYIGVQTLEMDKYMSKPLRAKLCEIWYNERCKRDSGQPYQRENYDLLNKEFDTMLQGIRDFKVIYTIEAMSDKEMKKVSDEIADSEKISVVVRGSALDGRKMKKGLDLYVTERDVEDEVEPVYIKHGDIHIFSMDSDLFIDVMSDYSELIKSASLCLENLEKKSSILSNGIIGLKEHKLFETLFSLMSITHFRENLIHSNNNFKIDNSIIFSKKDIKTKNYFRDRLIELLSKENTFGKPELKYLSDSFESTVLIKCDYTNTNNLYHIIKKLVKYPPGFRGLDKLFIVLNDYDYKHPKILSNVMNNVLKHVKLSNQYDSSNPDIIQYLNNLQYRVFILNIPAWFSLFNSQIPSQIIQNIKTPIDFDYCKLPYVDYLKTIIKYITSHFKLEPILNTNPLKFQQYFEHLLANTLCEKNIVVNYTNNNRIKRLDLDSIFDFRTIFHCQSEKLLYIDIKPSLSHLNNQLALFGIAHAAKNQLEFDNTYKDRESNTKWLRLSCGHHFIASKALIDDRNEAGLNPCTICNPIRYVKKPDLTSINSKYSKFGIHHAAQSQQQFDQLYVDRESDTHWIKSSCGHQFIASKKFIDDRIMAGLDPCTVCSPKNHTLKPNLFELNAKYNNFGLQHTAKNQEEFNKIYYDYKSDTEWFGTLCGHRFIASRNLIDKRIKAGNIPCTICNPLKISSKPSLSHINSLYIPHGLQHIAQSEEQFLNLYSDYNTETQWFRQSCNHLFSAPRFLIDWRIKSNLNPCTICLPVNSPIKPTLDKINSIYSPFGLKHAAQFQNEFEKLYLDYNSETYWIRFSCGHRFSAPRYLIEKRIKSGLNPCTVCLPLNNSFKFSLSQINSLYINYGIEHLAKNQEEFNSLYKNNRTPTKWHRILCGHVFIASKYNIDNRIKKGKNPCTICNPIKGSYHGEGGI